MQRIFCQGKLEVAELSAISKRGMTKTLTLFAFLNIMFAADFSCRRTEKTINLQNRLCRSAVMQSAFAFEGVVVMDSISQAAEKPVDTRIIGGKYCKKNDERDSMNPDALRTYAKRMYLFTSNNRQGENDHDH